MANNTQTFVGRVLLDDKQAKQTIALLEKQLEQVKQKRLILSIKEVIPKHSTKK